ncbi:MAG: NlpC/P60 family protein [Lachnospiraceae bacterium]
MNYKIIKKYLAVSAISGTLMFAGEFKEVNAANIKLEVPRGVIETALDDYQTYPELAFARTENFTYIRSNAKEKSDWVGKLYKDSAAKVLGGNGKWVRVESGSVTGYVKAEELLLDETIIREREWSLKTAMVTADVLNVREGQGTDTSILTQVTENQALTLFGEPINGWVPIQVGEMQGYVCETYVDIQNQYSYAESKEEEAARLAQEAQMAEEARVAEEIRAAEEARLAEEARIAQEQQAVTASASTGGQAVVNYACQFIGNPYVWGGTDLVNGADCSGFIQSVYANFGISLPRTTYDIENVGMAVDYSMAIPGDIVCYDGHAGIYMGNGQIINAIDDDHGINISSATFGYIRSVRRIL